MDTPCDVMIHNELLGLKGSPGTLMQTHESGCYEVNLKFGPNTHRVLLPVTGTVLISKEPEPEVVPTIEVER